jgi:hypothetical protein
VRTGALAMGADARRRPLHPQRGCAHSVEFANDLNALFSVIGVVALVVE